MMIEPPSFSTGLPGIALCMLFAGFAAGPSAAQETMKLPQAAIEAQRARPAPQVRVVGDSGEPIPASRPVSEVESYCLNIADKAQDARYALERQELADLETEIAKRIDELEAKRDDYQAWLAKRQEFLDGASTIVVDIYAAMSADAAAAQLAMLERVDAASVITRLKSRQASAILSEMKPEIAAEIAALIVEKTSAGTSADASPSAPKAETRS